MISLVLLLSPMAAFAADFDLVPKAFKTNPLLDMTVITEMTDEGRQRPPASRERPVYFASIFTRMQEEGRGDAGLVAPPLTLLEETMQRALAANGFLPADEAHPPTLLIVCDWGVYNKPSTELDEDGKPSGELGDGDTSGGNLLNRAALIGGTEFAQKLAEAIKENQLLKLSQSDWHPLLNPLRRFRDSSPTNRILYDRLQCELYFVVATAFDFESVARKQPVRLWRSKLTVDSASVNMSDTLPSLIIAGASYLGRDTPQAVALRKRPMQGRVDLGPLNILEDSVELSPPPPAK